MDESKKEFILKETLGYFLKYGVKNFTMDDIANKLGVSKKTLYQMFCNKENLLFEAVDELWESFLVQIHEIEQEEINPLQKIVKIYDCFTGINGTQTEVYTVLNLKSKDLINKTL